ncbi:hypothetical protein N566_10910 [Streptomycetaceae bacterium MP113-05]|nr:hypothetical protein N566_10910 [Streptomycetaceae bacterium MP113-05]
MRLACSRSDATSGDTAAATALDLSVEVDPGDLGVAEVTGSVTLAETTCTAPRPASSRAPENTPETRILPGKKEQAAAEPAGPELAVTGSGPAAPYLVGGAALLLAAGAVTVVAVCRRRP